VSRRSSSTLLGLFVVVAVALGVAALILLGGGHLFQRTDPYVVYFRGSVSGLSVGAPVKFKGVEIGSVKEIYVTMSTAAAGAAEVRIPVVIAVDREKVRRSGTAGELSYPERVAQLMESGLRAQLATSSFVTNQRYIALDVIPGAPEELVNDPAFPYPEIATVPTALENAEKLAGEVLAQLSSVDIGEIFRSTQRTLDGLDRLVNGGELEETLRALQRGAKSFEETTRNIDAVAISLRRLVDDAGPDVVAIGKNVRRASETAARVAEQSETLLASLRDVVEPAGPAVFSIHQGLAEVTATARSLRRFIEKLDRDPGILVRGGNP
jgi:ABC-type transporter Mla subunit MlaD